jgi:hypothetical protein
MSTRWKVVRCQFSSLERSLNEISEKGWFVWKLIVLDPEKTKTSKHEIVLIVSNDEHYQDKLDPSKRMITRPFGDFQTGRHGRLEK